MTHLQILPSSTPPSLGESCIVTFSVKFSDKKTFQKLESKRNKRRIKSASNVGSKLGNFKIRTWLRRRKKNLTFQFLSRPNFRFNIGFTFLSLNWRLAAEKCLQVWVKGTLVMDPRVAAELHRLFKSHLRRNATCYFLWGHFKAHFSKNAV